MKLVSWAKMLELIRRCYKRNNCTISSKLVYGQQTKATNQDLKLKLKFVLWESKHLKHLGTSLICRLRNYASIKPPYGRTPINFDH